MRCDCSYGFDCCNCCGRDGEPIPTDFGDIEEVVTEFALAVEQHRHQFIVLCLKHRIGIDIDHADLGCKFCRQGFQGLFHVMAEVAVATADQRQFDTHVSCFR